MKVLDRMTAFEAPRVSDPARPTSPVELLWRGSKDRKKGATRQMVNMPRMRPMPDIITCQGRSFVRRDDAHYFEGTMWPLLPELDG